MATSLCDWKTPSPSRVSSEGGGGSVVGKHPPSSHVSSEGGGGVVGKVAWLENIPLRLTFRVREGVVVWLGNIPPVSRFERGRGWCG